MRIRTILVVLVLAFFATSAEAQPPKVRKNIDDLSAGELANFLHALELLKNTPGSELSSYETFERLHNGGTLPNGKVGGCVHNHSHFLPWHRMLLAQFETALQQTDPPRTSNVMLPYWDFSKDPSGKRFPKAFEVDSNALWHANRLNWSADLPPDWIQFINDQEDERKLFMADDFLESTLFGLDRYRSGSGEAGFSNGLESSPHNVMHTPFTLGDMASDVTAARDPVFWSFHCYIDLMWYQWQVRHAAFAGADAMLLPEELTKEYDHFPKPMTVSSVLNPHDLGYTYMLPNDEPEPESLTAADKLKPLEGNKFQFAWKTPAQPEAVPKKPGATLAIADLKHTGNGSWKIEVYLHPKSVEPKFDNLEFRKKYFAAQYAVWQGNHRPGHHHATEKELLLRLANKPVSQSLTNGDYILSVRYRALPSTIKEAVAPQPEVIKDVPLSYSSVSVKFD